MFLNLNEQRERTTNEYNCVIIWYQISVRNGISYSYLLIYFFEVFARARLNSPATSDARILISRGWPYWQRFAASTVGKVSRRDLFDIFLVTTKLKTDTEVSEHNKPIQYIIAVYSIQATTFIQSGQYFRKAKLFLMSISEPKVSNTHLWSCYY